jgi:hypothetical protein
MAANIETQPDYLNPEAHGYWSKENRIARDMADARFDYEIAMWKAIGQPEAKRENVPQDFQPPYDWLRSPTIIRTNKTIEKTFTAVDNLLNVNGNIMTGRDSAFEYLQGLKYSLKQSIHSPIAGFKNEPPIEAAGNRIEITGWLAEAKAEEVKWNAGKENRAFVSNYPNWLSRIRGYIDGYAWVLGLTDTDLLANAQAEIDKLPKPSWFTPKPGSSPK